MIARAAFALAVFAWASAAHASADAFLCTPDAAVVPFAWDGESVDSTYKDCVQFDWVGFGAALDPPAPGGAPGTPTSVLGPVVFAGRLDSLFPTLLYQCLNATVFDVDLFVRPPASANWTTKVSFTDAVISDVQAAGTSEVPATTVSIRARTVTWTSRTYNGTTLTGETTVTWTAPGP